MKLKVIMTDPVLFDGLKTGDRVSIETKTAGILIFNQRTEKAALLYHPELFFLRIEKGATELRIDGFISISESGRDMRRITLAFE